MAVNDTHELIVRGLVHGQTHIHTLHFRELVAIEGSQELAEDYQTNLLTAYRACFPGDIFPAQVIRAQKVCGSVPLSGPHEINIATAGTVGTSAATGNREAAFMACNVKVSGTLAGKRSQGRFFLGGLRSGDRENDTLTPAYIARVRAYCDALIARYVGVAPAAGFRLVVHSRLAAAAIPPPQCQVSSTPVASMTVNPGVTTMRSRKVGSGT